MRKYVFYYFAPEPVDLNNINIEDESTEQPAPKLTVKRDEFSADSWQHAETLLQMNGLDIIAVINVYSPLSRLLVHYLDYYFSEFYDGKSDFIMLPMYLYWDFYDKALLQSQKYHTTKGLDVIGYFNDNKVFNHVKQILQ